VSKYEASLPAMLCNESYYLSKNYTTAGHMKIIFKKNNKRTFHPFKKFDFVKSEMLKLLKNDWSLLQKLEEQ
jgi:hypothetical protein